MQIDMRHCVRIKLYSTLDSSVRSRRRQCSKTSLVERVEHQRMHVTIKDCELVAHCTPAFEINAGVIQVEELAATLEPRAPHFELNDELQIDVVRIDVVRIDVLNDDETIAEPEDITGCVITPPEIQLNA